MRQDIINQMEAELNDSYWCKRDFEYDLKELEDYDEPFFFMVRKNGTSLCRIGKTKIAEWSENQVARFQMFRDKNWPVLDFTYWMEEGAKYFYYNGYDFISIQKNAVLDIWGGYLSMFYEDLKAKYHDEYEARDVKIEIKYASEETEKRMQETLSIAKEMSDTSLETCLNNLLRHLRCSMDHHILIYTDFEKYSFYWVEIMNDEPKMNGGIIYYDRRENNHWQIHT